MEFLIDGYTGEEITDCKISETLVKTGRLSAPCKNMAECSGKTCKFKPAARFESKNKGSITSEDIEHNMLQKSLEQKRGQFLQDIENKLFH